MKIKKILLILIVILCLSGCVNINNLNLNDIVGIFNTEPQDANMYRKGFEFYVPKGIKLEKAGTNYVILSSSDIKYYLYIDFISYNNKNEISYEINNKAYFSRAINDKKGKGFIEINLRENNQYLVEIMYNYAKIEVMVDKSLLNNTLVNSINILNSIKYNDVIIENLLNDNNLDYTEEIFDVFGDIKDRSDTLDYIEDNNINTDNKEEIKDTDYIN